MNNSRQDEILIESYKKDFIERTGRSIKITTCKKWEGLANFTDKVEFWTVVYIVFEFTGWKLDETYVKSRTDEKIFRRGLIDYIAHNNGCTLVSIGKLSGRDHTTIMNSIKCFENWLDTEKFAVSIFNEILEYLKENYYTYKSRVMTREKIKQEFG